MNIDTLYEGFKTLGSIVGILITFITFFGLISKRPRTALRKLIKEESELSHSEINEKLNHIESRLKDSDEADIVSLRHSMTNMYHLYKDKEEIPHYAKEDWLSMYDYYQKQGGNSYIHTITEEMLNWKEK